MLFSVPMQQVPRSWNDNINVIRDKGTVFHVVLVYKFIVCTVIYKQSRSSGPPHIVCCPQLGTKY